MKRALLILCASVLLGAAGLTSALADSAFTDTVGDPTGDAPDITAVSVSNDTGGQILFQVSVSNFTPESMLLLAFDTDKNAATGDNGDEYMFGWMVSADANNNGWSAERWDGTQWVEAAHSTMRAALTPTGLQFSVNKSELGGTSGFAFAAFAARFTADAITGSDRAPDGIASWTYDLTTPAPVTPAPTPKPRDAKPVFGRLLVSFPVAGQTAHFTLQVKRSDTGGPLKTGRLVCDPSVAGKVLKHTESFKGGNVNLTFKIPKSAKGKTLKVKVTIVNGTQSATKITTLPIL